MIELVETPRDAMQGMREFIPTETKAEYLNEVLKVGFDIVDFGSFVSPKAIPQLRDTAEVLEMLDLSGSKSKLLVIIANLRGAQTAANFGKITYLGYPHSTSNIFLQKNINSNIEKSRQVIQDIFSICEKNEKELTVYYSMAFGNPYDEPWHPDQLVEETELLKNIGVRRIVISDTIGVGTPENISIIFQKLVPEFPEIRFGLHLHTTLENWCKKLDAAYQNGCRSFEGVMNGLGGCPMAGYELIGNIRTGLLLQYLRRKKIDLKIDRNAFEHAMTKSITTFASLDLKN